MTKQGKHIEPEFIGVDQAEIMSGVSRWTWRKKAYSGEISSIKVGRRLLIPIAEIRRILSEGTRPALESR
jgi:hypothetical protein